MTQTKENPAFEKFNMQDILTSASLCAKLTQALGNYCVFHHPTKQQVIELCEDILKQIALTMPQYLDLES